MTKIIKLHRSAKDLRSIKKREIKYVVCLCAFNEIDRKRKKVQRDAKNAHA